MDLPVEDRVVNHLGLLIDVILPCGPLGPRLQSIPAVYFQSGG